MNRLLAIGLVTIGMLGAACTEAGPQPRDALPLGAIAPASRETGERARGPAARPAHHHHHAEHARVP